VSRGVADEVRFSAVHGSRTPHDLYSSDTDPLQSESELAVELSQCEGDLTVMQSEQETDLAVSYCSERVTIVLHIENQ
jgi:hypothetical protein